MMINSLVLQNFQTHKNSNLNFTNGINVITGQSDQGKSSIIRALYWVFFNSLTGNEFINWESDTCSVSVQIADHVITRTKSKSNNSYIIDNKKYDAVRSNIPSQLHEIIKLTETNIQLQDDPYFLLFESSGEIARRLNDLVGINQIDSSLQFINQHYRKQHTSFQVLSEEMESKKTQLNAYQNLPEIEKIINVYNNLVESKQKTQQNIKLLENFCLNLTNYDYVVLYREQLNKLTKYLQQYQILLKKIETVQQQIHKLSTYTKLNKIIYKQKQLTVFVFKLNNLIIQYENTLNMIEQLPIQVLNHLINNLNVQNNKIIEIQKYIQTVNVKFTQLKLQLKICPLCDQTLGED